jgi:predicted enzyme related to lactoylglutathione lyase
MPTDTNSSKPPVSFAPAPKKAFAFVAIPATDPSRCQAFYESVFGWTFWQAPGTPVTVFFTGGEVMGRISKAEKVITENHEDGSVGSKC